MLKKKKQLDDIGLNSVLSEEEWREHDIKVKEISQQLAVQRFIHDSEYFEEIKNVNKELLDQVHFSEKQNKLIQTLIAHPKLEGIISWHGLTLVEEFW